MKTGFRRNISNENLENFRDIFTSQPWDLNLSIDINSYFNDLEILFCEIPTKVLIKCQ